VEEIHPRNRIWGGRAKRRGVVFPDVREKKVGNREGPDWGAGNGDDKVDRWN